MGYVSKVFGELNVNRPVITPKYSDEFMKFAERNGVKLEIPTGLSSKAITQLKTDSDLRIWFSSVTEDTVKFDAQWSYYEFDELMRTIIDLIEKDGCISNGSIVIDGEDYTDLSRFVITDNKIKYEKAKLTWPDGTEA